MIASDVVLLAVISILTSTLTPAFTSQYPTRTLIAVAAITAMQGLGTSIRTTFNNAASAMNG